MDRSLFFFIWFGDLTTLFLYIYCSFIGTYIHTVIHNIRWGPSLYHRSCRLSGRNFHGVPSWDSNSGLPYSKPVYFLNFLFCQVLLQEIYSTIHWELLNVMCVLQLSFWKLLRITDQWCHLMLSGFKGMVFTVQFPRLLFGNRWLQPTAYMVIPYTLSPWPWTLCPNL